jgi:hypothetical protein
MSTKPRTFEYFPPELAVPYGPYRAVVEDVTDGDTIALRDSAHDPAYVSLAHTELLCEGALGQRPFSLALSNLLSIFIRKFSLLRGSVLYRSIGQRVRIGMAASAKGNTVIERCDKRMMDQVISKSSALFRGIKRLCPLLLQRPHKPCQWMNVVGLQVSALVITTSLARILVTRKDTWPPVLRGPSAYQHHNICSSLPACSLWSGVVPAFLAVFCVMRLGSTAHRANQSRVVFPAFPSVIFSATSLCGALTQGGATVSCWYLVDFHPSRNRAKSAFALFSDVAQRHIAIFIAFAQPFAVFVRHIAVAYMDVALRQFCATRIVRVRPAKQIYTRLAAYAP